MNGRCIYQKGYGPHREEYAKMYVPIPEFGHKLHDSHRLIWQRKHGEINNRLLYVCHKCDNKACINVNHMFLGTPADNMQDSIRKGRQHRNGKRYKLTAVNVKEIRIRHSNGETAKDLGKLFGVHRDHIYGIISYKYWPKHGLVKNRSYKSKNKKNNGRSYFVKKQ
tara:strand:- start:502 stop:999 length:498 start_codon:yes stop_codon:yes gene_type:complete